MARLEGAALLGAALLAAAILTAAGCGGPGPGPGGTGAMPSDPTAPAAPAPMGAAGGGGGASGGGGAVDLDDVDVDRDAAIPPKEFPAPGKCRVWHPGKSPDEQPPAAACERARKALSPGDWLIERTWEQPARVRVIEHSSESPPTPVRVRLYTADRGLFLGERPAGD